MKHRLVKLALLLILGAIINIGVCWIISVRLDPNLVASGELGHSDIGDSGIWETLCFTSFGRVRMRSWWVYDEYESFITTVGCPQANELVPEWAINIDNFQPIDINENEVDIWAEATGWPFLAMISHFEDGHYFQNESGIYINAMHDLHGWVITYNYGIDYRIIPLHPIWPGFAINTIFYATILWLLTLAPFTARRMIRRKRGHCIKCGYDLRGDILQGCPECGWGRKAEG